MWVRGEIHGLGLYCTLLLSSGGRGRWPAGCLFLAFTSSAKLQLLRPNQPIRRIRTRNELAANRRTLTASQVCNLATVDSPAAILYCDYWLFGIWLIEQCS